MYSAETDSGKGKGSYVATPVDYVAWTEGDVWSGKPLSLVWCRFLHSPIGGVSPCAYQWLHGIFKDSLYVKLLYPCCLAPNLWVRCTSTVYSKCGIAYIHSVVLKRRYFPCNWEVSGFGNKRVPFVLAVSWFVNISPCEMNISLRVNYLRTTNFHPMLSRTGRSMLLHGFAGHITFISLQMDPAYLFPLVFLPPLLFTVPHMVTELTCVSPKLYGVS